MTDVIPTSARINCDLRGSPPAPNKETVLEGTIPFEAGRIWTDGAPLSYFLEIIFRSAIAYFYCFLLIKLLSGRAVAQMSMSDLVLIIALGSAVGDLTFYQDVPILHALAAITVIILLTKAADRAIHNQKLLKRVLSNSPVTLVHEGVIDMSGASRRDLNPLEVMELLRVHQIRNLGEVEWAFMEAGGQCSVFKAADPRPGLSIVPPHDLEPFEPSCPCQPLFGTPACCFCCGTVRESYDGPKPCPNCQNDAWIKPTLSRTVSP